MWWQSCCDLALPSGARVPGRRGASRHSLPQGMCLPACPWRTVLASEARSAATAGPDGAAASVSAAAPTVGLEPTTTRLRALRSTG